MAPLIRPLSIDCEGAAMAGILHLGGEKAGILMASGGLQTRAGPHRLYTELAASLAESSATVLRFDRRGIGDSDGEIQDFADCQADLDAAAAVLRGLNLPRLVGFGLCDGAASLALFGADIGLTDLVLLNPWSFETSAAPALPPSAQRKRLLKRLFSLPALKRLLSGQIDIASALRGFAARRTSEDTDTADLLVNKINAFNGNVSILLSELDATAQHFAALLSRLRSDIDVIRLQGADHSLTRAQDRKALFTAICDQLGID